MADIPVKGDQRHQSDEKKGRIDNERIEQAIGKRAVGKGCERQGGENCQKGRKHQIDRRVFTRQG